MAAVVSPTPLSFSSATTDYRRPSRVTRPVYHRTYANKPLSNATTQRHALKNVGDSSDEDDIAPIKLSAEAQAILEDNSQASSDKENLNVSSLGRRSSRNGLSSETKNGGRQIHASSLLQQEVESPVPRVIRVVSEKRPAIPTTLGRDGSFMYKIHDKTAYPASKNTLESKTPVTNQRIIRVSGGRRSSKSPSPVHTSTENKGNEVATYQEASQWNKSPEMVAKIDTEDDVAQQPSTATRLYKSEDVGVHSTMRVRRVGVGSLLGKPVRRGMIRRPSEDEVMSMDQYEHDHELSRSPEVETGRRAKESDLEDVPDLGLIGNGSPQMPVRKFSPLNERSTSPMRILQQKPHLLVEQPHITSLAQKATPTPPSNSSHPSTKSSGSQRKPVFKIPSLPPLPAERDQENEPPPTFKKSKPAAALLQIHEDVAPKEDKHHIENTPASPERPPLAIRSNNTPHRPAPIPPPKMSLIEAATSNAGSRKKGSSHIMINGRTYRRLDCIGRGGSSRVYRIMAENFQIFAMKRVNLEDADMAAIAGYKGEIDLLKKLENVDRVIRLFDYEILEEKGLLNVMMELGESDFNKMLNEQLKSENAKLDITFTRHYWKEMLECVAAVHKHDIVHSDLKPANFLLVKGQLKLIDFGIANAIQDNTVNVHRENQIGTPNYMSPESLVCQIGSGPNGGKQIKLGKPSDVWSLGCILYQMTYGQPPFAHITQQMQRIYAIPNPEIVIQFPTRGLGGSVVPFGLIKTLRRCLTREQSLRPTVAELLSDGDPFLCPVAISPDMLGRVIGNVVSYCRRREDVMRAQGQLIGEGVSSLPKDEEMKGWPLAFYDKLRQAQDEGTAW